MNHEMKNNAVGRIGLLSSSYPPQIDGVANAVWNYSRYLEKNHEGAIVVAPKIKQPETVESPSPVLRYASIDTAKKLGYPAGVPMAPDIARVFQKQPPSLLHAHDPLVSVMIARELKNIYDVPSIMSYHTKFDQDITALVKNKAVADLALKMIRDNASACDEVWVVSRGAGENLRLTGYEGEMVVMPNGVDMPHEKASEEAVREYCGDLPAGVPIFLFIGRMIKAKGILQIISALAILRAKNIDFRMVFIGDGRDFDLLKSEAKAALVEDKCVFLGRIQNREILHAWNTRADLLIFPSEYDTQGLVVVEAAAAGTPALLIRGSAAAENVQDDVNGFLTENDPTAIAERIMKIVEHPELLEAVSRGASRDLYWSWEDAVDSAYERYQIVLDKYRSGQYKQRKLPGDGIMKAQAAYMSAVAKLFP